MWSYAMLSKWARNSGGPEKLVNNIFADGLKKGHREMIPVALMCLLAGYGVSKLVDYIKKKNAASDAKVAEIKQELINGINEYDRTHPTEE